MKICMMTNTYLPHVGGVARSVHTFSESLRRRGHSVLVVAPNFPGDELLPPRVQQHVVRLPAIQHFNGSDFSVRLPLSSLLKPELQAFVPDIVHSHHPYLIGDSALRLGARRNAPVVFTHHTLHEEYTHYVPLDSPALKQFVIELCTRYANLCDAVIAPSASIARLIQERGVVAPTEIVPTGIPVQSFAGGHGEAFRKANRLPENAFVVGHVGRLAPEKNLDYLGAAVSGFLKENREARFLMVGDGALAPRLREQFARENLADRLVMPGKLNGKPLYDAYAAMDVFVFSSLTETQGMVLAEAMAAGLPVVALDAPAVREVVRDGENGFLIPTQSGADRFVEPLGQLFGNKTLRRCLSEGARQTARGFSRENSTTKLLALYEQVLRSKRRQRTAAEESDLAGLFKRIEMEWLLISEKAEAVFKAMAADEGAEVA